MDPRQSKFVSPSRPALNPPADIPLTVLPPHPCPYLPGRTATFRALLARSLPNGFYRELMNVGFRRSGRLIYQPVCEGCRACVQLRVPVATFVASASQRRCLRKNSDLHVTVGAPTSTDEKFELYQRYQRDWHLSLKQSDNDSRESFESFLYESPVESIEFCYRAGSGKLLAVGICDVDDESLSSVYFYFDPETAARGLGTFGALQELAYANTTGRRWYYLGFWVRDCSAMAYKSRFQPHQLLREDGIWYDVIS